MHGSQGKPVQLRPVRACEPCMSVSPSPHARGMELGGNGPVSRPGSSASREVVGAQGRGWQALQVDDLARVLAIFWTSGSPEGAGSTSASGTVGGGTAASQQGQGVSFRRHAEGRERYRPPHLRRDPGPPASPSGGCDSSAAPHPPSCPFVGVCTNVAAHVGAVSVHPGLHTLFQCILGPSLPRCVIRRRTCWTHACAGIVKAAHV